MAPPPPKRRNRPAPAPRADEAERRLIRIITWMKERTEPFTRDDLVEAFPRDYAGSAGRGGEEVPPRQGGHRAARHRAAARRGGDRQLPGRPHRAPPGPRRLRAGRGGGGLDGGARRGPGRQPPAARPSSPRRCASSWSAPAASPPPCPARARWRRPPSRRRWAAGWSCWPTRCSGGAGSTSSTGGAAAPRRCATWTSTATACATASGSSWATATCATRRGSSSCAGWWSLQAGRGAGHDCVVPKDAKGGDYPVPRDFDFDAWKTQRPWDYLAHAPLEAVVRLGGTLAPVARKLLPGAGGHRRCPTAGARPACWSATSTAWCARCWPGAPRPSWWLAARGARAGPRHPRAGRGGPRAVAPA